jgi:hypothetical protein
VDGAFDLMARVFVCLSNGKWEGHGIGNGDANGEWCDLLGIRDWSFVCSAREWGIYVSSVL